MALRVPMFLIGAAGLTNAAIAVRFEIGSQHIVGVNKHIQMIASVRHVRYGDA